MAADHELPWPPEHLTTKRGRPNFDAAWVRAMLRCLLADGDSLLISLANALGGGSLGWSWTRSLPNLKKCRRRASGCGYVATTSCAVEKARTKEHICPVLKDQILDFAGDIRARRQYSMAHSLRVARHFCPLFENIHAQVEAQLCTNVFETRATAVAQTIPFDEVVGSHRGGIVTALHGEKDVPTSHARDHVRHGLRRSAFRAVDTVSARPWLVSQAAQSRQAGLAFACGADRTQRQPHAEDLMVPGSIQHSAVSHRQHR